MIEIQNVTLFLQKKEILHEISARFNEGNIYGLVGRNGSGKTMLMRCICGFVRPSSGQIIYRDNQLVKCVGRDVDYMPECGVIIENPGFIPFFSGYKNLISLANIRKKIGKHEVRKAMQQGNPNEKETMAGARGADYEGMKIHSVRLPGYVASQEVIFGGQGETLKISTDPINRECYMPGVALGCRKIVDQVGLVYGLDKLL